MAQWLSLWCVIILVIKTNKSYVGIQSFIWLGIWKCNLIIKMCFFGLLSYYVRNFYRIASSLPVFLNYLTSKHHPTNSSRNAATVCHTNELLKLSSRILNESRHPKDWTGNSDSAGIRNRITRIMLREKNHNLPTRSLGQGGGKVAINNIKTVITV